MNKLVVPPQLRTVRHPGVPLARILDTIPASMISFVAEQIGVRPDDLASYGLPSQTITDHAREIALGMRAAERGDIPMMIEAGWAAAASTDTLFTPTVILRETNAMAANREVPRRDANREWTLGRSLKPRALDPSASNLPLFPGTLVTGFP